ncbi:CLUMA_CG004675, isoform A [Clunio marinus]|uniref:CLUMA_CG004675, isoform A n=1 Tax=Clunio marinus TaxID=568069 RepID=A0A1J1HSM1_9DIPT|nr:CLUMA_CG004675, isoform A [Clunio marinus]
MRVVTSVDCILSSSSTSQSKHKYFMFLQYLPIENIKFYGESVSSLAEVLVIALQMMLNYITRRSRRKKTKETIFSTRARFINLKTLNSLEGFLYVLDHNISFLNLVSIYYKSFRLKYQKKSKNRKT